MTKDEHLLLFAMGSALGALLVDNIESQSERRKKRERQDILNALMETMRQTAENDNNEQAVDTSCSYRN